MLADRRSNPDESYLSSLQRLEQAPKSGCGFLDLSDCQACIRAEIRKTLDELEPPGTKRDTAP